MSNKSKGKHIQQTDPKKKQTDNLTQQIAIGRREITVSSGPLPDPDTLAKYKAIAPKSVEVIIDMAQSESKNRQQIESELVKSAISQNRRGQNFAFILALFILSMCGWALYLEHVKTAGILAGFSLLSTISIFLKNANKKAEK